MPLRGITRGRDGLYRLEGPYVQITGEAGIGGTAYAPPAERRPDAFRYGRADDGFEAVMAYYHIDASQRHVQALDLDRAIQEAPISVNPHGLGDFDDSKFYPAQNALAFGQGGIDDAEDADVIWHEYGHALLEGSAPGLLGTTEGRALHEGWADYWAASYARSLVEAGLVPEGDWRRLFPWDGNNGGWQGRRLDHAGRYPDDLTGNIYTDGVLWATTLMEVYDDLGRETTDRLSLHSHAYLSHPVTMQDAAEALLQADEDLHGGAHLGVLLDRLGARGFVDVGAYGPIIVHEPLLATEQQGGSVAFDVGVVGPTSPVEAVAVFYRSADGSGPGAKRLDPANLFDVGPLLARVTEAILAAGATPILAHHLRKNRDNPEAPPELEDLAYAGVQEFARQWILIGRRTPYEPGTGEHQLWLSGGGSAGHSGAWALDVSEGVVDEDFNGRRWETRLSIASQARQEARQQADSAKAERSAERTRASDEAKLKRLAEDCGVAMAALDRLKDHSGRAGYATKTKWRNSLVTWDSRRFNQVCERLLDEGKVAPIEVTIPCGKATRNTVGLCVVRPGEPHRDDTGIGADHPGVDPGPGHTRMNGDSPPPKGGESPHPGVVSDPGEGCKGDPDADTRMNANHPGVPGQSGDAEGGRP